MSAKVRLVQLLCPNRHCVVAAAYLPGESTFDEAVAFLRNQLQSLEAEWRCGICGSRRLGFEDAETRYDSLAQAAPELAREQAAQLHTWKVIDDQRERSRN